jgi:hypothetical protein
MRAMVFGSIRSTDADRVRTPACLHARIEWRIQNDSAVGFDDVVGLAGRVLDRSISRDQGRPGNR